MSLLLDRRHVFRFAAVEHRHFGALAQCGARRIDRGVATTDDRHSSANDRFFPGGHRLQEAQGWKYAFQFRTRLVDPRLFPGSNRDKNRVKAIIEIVQRQIEADAGVEDEFHSQPLNLFNFAPQ